MTNMNSEVGNVEENVAARVAKAKRNSRVPEVIVIVQQEVDRTAIEDQTAGLTPKTAQTEPRIQPLLCPPPSDSSSTVLGLIERLALDPRADVEKLERVITLHERLKAKEAELAYNSAKGRILKKLTGIKIVKNRSVLHEIDKRKSRKGAYEAFRYAPLEEIDKHLRPLLAEGDMDLSYSNEPLESGGILIRGRLKHLPGGHYEDSFMPAPLDTTGGKSDVQAVGSTNSFLRRYVACNIFNIVVVGDDDGGTGRTIDEAQTETILDLINKAKAGPKFLKYMKALSVEETGSLEAAVATISARDYRKAINTLEEQIGKSEAGDANLSS
jgi:hypothetical protein